jgi:hypothetical protein
MPHFLNSGIATAALLLGAAAFCPLPASAEGYDIDCAVILCLAAGFPSEPSGTCSDAYDYMIDRITDLPPKPPFGLCIAGGGAYDLFSLAFSRHSRQSPDGWVCPEPGPIAFDPTKDYLLASPFCYPDAEHLPPLFVGRPDYWLLGAPVEADRVAYRFQLTIPTVENSAAYVSPVFLSDPATEFSRALISEEWAEHQAQPVLPVEGVP